VVEDGLVWFWLYVRIQRLRLWYRAKLVSHHPGWPENTEYGRLLAWCPHVDLENNLLHEWCRFRTTSTNVACSQRTGSYRNEFQHYGPINRTSLGYFCSNSSEIRCSSSRD
jgi:hypothetical protein